MLQFDCELVNNFQNGISFFFLKEGAIIDQNFCGNICTLSALGQSYFFFVFFVMGNIFFLTRYHSSTIVGYMEVAIESFPTNEPNPFPHFSLLLPFGAYIPKFFSFFSCIEIGV